MNIKDPFSELNRVSKMPSLHSQDILPLISLFKGIAVFNCEQTQPKDSSSLSQKNLFFSEYEVWSSLEELCLCENTFKALNEPQKIEKFTFFKDFNPAFSNIFETRDVMELNKLCMSQCYLNTSLLSDFSLITDIINYDETLFTLYCLTQKIGNHDSETKNILRASLSGNEAVDSLKVAQSAEWDFMGSNEAEIREYQARVDARIFEEVYYFLRKGKVYEAQEYLILKNRFVLAALLNSGLAFHDFTVLDSEIFSDPKEIQGVLVGNVIEEEIDFSLQWEKRVMPVEKINSRELRALDFMLCKDFIEVSQERRQFYLEKEITKENEFYQGSCGNKNWLYSLSNFWLLSLDCKTRYEKAFYSYMSSNLEGLLPLSPRFSDKLWAYLRCFLNQEILRRFVTLTYLYKENLLNFCLFDHNFVDFERSLPWEIYEQISHKPDNRVSTIDMALKSLSFEENIDELYNKAHFLLLKGKILIQMNGDRKNWKELFEYLLYLSQKNQTKSHEFSCFFAIILKLLGYCSPECANVFDEILLNFINISRNNINPQNILQIFWFMNNDALKIERISQYLLSITLKELNIEEIKRIKQTLLNLFPTLSQQILEKQFLLSSENYDSELSNDIKEISSLRWLFADNNHLEKAIALSLRLIRSFFLKEKTEKAKFIYHEYVMPFVKKDKIPPFFKQNKFDEEIDCFEKFFSAEEAYYEFLKNAELNEKNRRGSLKGSDIEAKNKIENCLLRHSLKKEKFLVIDLENNILTNILNADLERKETLFSVKSMMVTKSLEFLMKIHEITYKTLEEKTKLLEILTDIDYNVQKYILEGNYRTFLSRVTELFMKTPDFLRQWLYKTETEIFYPWFFT